VVIAMGVAAQEDPLTKVYSPEELREDLAVIKQTVEQAHPDPYRYTTKVELDLLFEAIGRSITVPITSEAFIATVRPALRLIGDAGTVLLPPKAVQQVYDHNEPMMPITVAVIGDRLYLNEELKGFRSLPTACELLSINGRTAA